MTFRYNYSHDAKVGHELKSRALHNYIYFNRFSDENGTASRSIDLPNGGFSVLMGNVIVQDQFSENSNIVGYGLEGLSNPNSALYVAYNTFVNNKSTGSFIQVANGTPTLKAYNNIFAGPGTLIAGTATLIDTMSNRAASKSAFHFFDSSAYDFHLGTGSVAVGIATNAGSAGGILLSPEQEYVHPNGFQTRVTTNDAGAFGLPIVSNITNLKQPGLLIYPNPVIDWIMLEGIETGTTVIVSDVSGKIWNRSTPSGQLDLREFPTGMYVLTVLKSGKFTSTSFMKL